MIFEIEKAVAALLDAAKILNHDIDLAAVEIDFLQDLAAQPFDAALQALASRIDEALVASIRALNMRRDRDYSFHRTRLSVLRTLTRAVAP